MADIETNAACARLQHGLFHLALGIDRYVREGPERVRQYVSRTQPVEHLFVTWWRMIDMGHERHADLVGDLQRDVEGHCVRATRGNGADAHLDADDNVAIGARDLDRVERG